MVSLKGLPYSVDVAALAGRRGCPSLIIVMPGNTAVDPEDLPASWTYPWTTVETRRLVAYVDRRRRLSAGSRSKPRSSAAVRSHGHDDTARRQVSNL